MNDRKLRWGVMQRGYWVHGVGNLRDYLASAETFTMKGRERFIRCPTLFIKGSDDPLAVSTQQFFESLTCSKELIQFSSMDGAGDHCQMLNRSLVNRVACDWLDSRFMIRKS